jgi:hypothetical protein
MSDRFKLKYFIPPSMEGGAPNLGEGISRHMPGETTRLYRALVKIPNNTPMTVLIRAENTRRAEKYARNRWPLSTVEILK